MPRSTPKTSKSREPPRSLPQLIKAQTQSEHRRRLFVLAYLADPHPKRAAVAAGFPEKSASTAGRILLKERDVSLAIAVAQGQLRQKFEINAENVLEEIRRLAFANIEDISYRDPTTGMLLYDFRNATREQLTQVAAVSYEEQVILEDNGVDEDGEPIEPTRMAIRKYKVHHHGGKLEALRDLARHTGIPGFIEKAQADGLPKVVKFTLDISNDGSGPDGPSNRTSISATVGLSEAGGGDISARRLSGEPSPLLDDRGEHQDG